MRQATLAHQQMTTARTQMDRANELSQGSAMLQQREAQQPWEIPIPTSPVRLPARLDEEMMGMHQSPSQMRTPTPMPASAPAAHPFAARPPFASAPPQSVGPSMSPNAKRNNVGEGWHKGLLVNRLQQWAQHIQAKGVNSRSTRAQMVEAIENSRMVPLLSTVQLQEVSPAVWTPQFRPNCSRCNNPMQLKRLSQRGAPFWACAEWPQCMGSKDI